MKVNIIKRINNDRDAVGWALIAAMTEASEGKGLAKELMPDNEGNVEVQFVVNGIELPFEFLMDRWYDQFNKLIKKRAVEILDEKFSKIQNVIYYLEEEVKRSARDLFPDEDWEDT